jgi:hypothetical protein
MVRLPSDRAVAFRERAVGGAPILQQRSIYLPRTHAQVRLQGRAFAYVDAYVGYTRHTSPGVGH